MSEKWRKRAKRETNFFKSKAFFKANLHLKAFDLYLPVDVWRKLVGSLKENRIIVVLRRFDELSSEEYEEVSED